MSADLEKGEKLRLMEQGGQLKGQLNDKFASMKFQKSLDMTSVVLTGHWRMSNQYNEWMNRMI